MTPLIPSKDHQKSLEILAKSFVKNLKTGGYSTADILSLSSNILDIVISDVKEQKPRKH